MRRFLSQSHHHLTHKFTNHRHLPSFHPHSNLNYISIHNISTTKTVRTFTRNFTDRKEGSFTKPAKKSKTSKSTHSTNIDNDNEEISKPRVIHSKAVSRSMQSSVKTKIINESGDRDVKMTFSQQMEKRSETDSDDPSKDNATSNTQTYKQMDVKSPEFTDSHTEISSSSESLSAADLNDIHQQTTESNDGVRIFDIEPNTNYDKYTVGNPSSEEIAWRKGMLSPNALIIHPDRLLPVLHQDSQKKYEKKGWGYWQRKIKQTFTSVRERIIGNEKYNEYSQRIKEKTETLSEQYDTSQNYHLVKIRGMIDRMNLQTESSKAMQIMQEEMSDFWVEDFLPAFDEILCPLIVRAYLNDDIDFLNIICVGEAQVFCKNMIEQRINEKKMLAPDILWIHEADLIETKLHNKKPQLVIRAEVQCIDCVYERGTDKVVEGSPSTVATNIFVMVLEPNLDDEYTNLVPLPWQVRSMTTARQRQLV